MVRQTPPRPRARTERKKAVQKASSLLSPIANPKTSRSPFAVTPAATKIALDTTDALSLALTSVVSRPPYGKATCSSRPHRRGGSCQTFTR
jgi:hypothetical protein